jgi:hypothetical protein
MELWTLNGMCYRWYRFDILLSHLTCLINLWTTTNFGGTLSQFCIIFMYT